MAVSSQSYPTSNSDGAFSPVPKLSTAHGVTSPESLATDYCISKGFIRSDGRRAYYPEFHSHNGAIQRGGFSMSSLNSPSPNLNYKMRGYPPPPNAAYGPSHYEPSPPKFAIEVSGTTRGDMSMVESVDKVVADEDPTVKNEYTNALLINGRRPSRTEHHSLVQEAMYHQQMQQQRQEAILNPANVQIKMQADAQRRQIITALSEKIDSIISSGNKTLATIRRVVVLQAAVSRQITLHREQASKSIFNRMKINQALVLRSLAPDSDAEHNGSHGINASILARADNRSNVGQKLQEHGTDENDIIKVKEESSGDEFENEANKASTQSVSSRLAGIYRTYQSTLTRVLDGGNVQLEAEPVPAPSIPSAENITALPGEFLARQIKFNRRPSHNNYVDVFGLSEIYGPEEIRRDFIRNIEEGAPLGYCKICKKTHIPPGPPFTIQDRDTCGSYVPDWFRDTPYENQLTEFVKLINEISQLHDIVNGSIPDREWNLHYHVKVPACVPGGRLRSGWWRCGVNDEVCANDLKY
ncbi:hypothetical protein BJ878DRAFT_224562 [Calycina marina]|uniref:Uncharacterized protein n=1 Tax=Calycina marina TaxID=1763456 RepID=A0A9P7YXH5_9HELO|nr:hypothetical protein BJ878DRAFT_224562 [Calycina marina]